MVAWVGLEVRWRFSALCLVILVRWRFSVFICSDIWHEYSDTRLTIDFVKESSTPQK